MLINQRAVIDMDIIDRRNFGRRSLCKVARLIRSDLTAVPATVLNMCEVGATIRLSEPPCIGNEFDLEVPEDDFAVQCRVIWLKEDAVGVEFVRSPRRLSWQTGRSTTTAGDQAIALSRRMSDTRLR